MSDKCVSWDEFSGEYLLYEKAVVMNKLSVRINVQKTF